MIIILIVLLASTAIALSPVWAYSRRWSWWPSILVWAIGFIVMALLLIERIEAS